MIKLHDDARLLDPRPDPTSRSPDWHRRGSWYFLPFQNAGSLFLRSTRSTERGDATWTLGFGSTVNPSRSGTVTLFVYAATARRLLTQALFEVQFSSSSPKKSSRTGDVNHGSSGTALLRRSRLKKFGPKINKEFILVRLFACTKLEPERKKSNEPREGPKLTERDKAPASISFLRKTR